MNSGTPLTTLLPNSSLIESARANGYLALDPIHRNVAIEFVVSGQSIAALALSMGLTKNDVRKIINDPLTRAFIADLQAEVAQHKIINAAWVETQVLAVWPKLTGEEEVDIVGKDGSQIKAKKFHSAEVTSILKHFSGNADQKGLGGTQVIINFGDMGVSREKVVVDVSGAEDV